MAKKLLTGIKAREALSRGVAQLSDMVTVTLSPLGRNIGIDKRWNAPTVLHDGVSIAKDIELKDPFENMGAQLVKEAASKTNDNAGDGTTTSTLIANIIIQEGMKRLQDKDFFFFKQKGVNPMTMKKGIEIAVQFATDQLQEQTELITTPGKLQQVATISSASPVIGKLIADAMEKIGKDGVIDVQEGTTITTEIEYKEGMEYDKGYASPYFVTNTDKMEAEIVMPVIVLYQGTIRAASEILFLNKILEQKERDIVIIAENIEGDALDTLALNKQRGTMNVLAVQAPAFAQRQKQMLEDIAVLTGATILSKETGKTLEDFKFEYVGRADKVWANDKTTRIVGGHGDQKEIQARIDNLKTKIAKEKNEFEKLKLQERLAKLASGVAIIKVGAQTEVEMKDLKERIKDAVEATKSAVEEGIIAGGGVALFHIGKELEMLSNEDYDIQAGIEVVAKALQAPLEKILLNAGVNPKPIMKAIASSKDDKNYGYNIETNIYGNLREMGVVDPKKVTRLAVQYAASVGAMILTTEGLITDDEDKKTQPTLG